MKVIELTRGKVAIVDDEDFDALAQFRWQCTKKGYAKRTFYIKGDYLTPKTAWMAIEILKPRPGFEVDHINGNKLDNRRCNLREATQQQQAWNTGVKISNKLGVKGIHFRRSKSKNSDSCKGKFSVRIAIDGQNKQIGSFDTLDEAKAAYNRAAIELRGTFARLN